MSKDKFCIEMKYLRPVLEDCIDKQKIFEKIVVRIASDIAEDTVSTSTNGSLSRKQKPEAHPSMALRRHLAKQLEELVLGDKK